MSGSHGSVFGDGGGALLCGVNWIGDAIMSMPAVQAFRGRHRDARIAMLVKPAVASLWRMHAAVDRVLVLGPGLGGVWRASAAVRHLGCERAYVLPQSFRSALVPYLARVPARIGMPGHHRDFMLTDVVTPTQGTGREHQGFEYADLLTPEPIINALAHPMLTVAAPAREAARRLLTEPDGRVRIALCPGAARGPSKQWPAQHFIELGKRLVSSEIGPIAVLGSSAEVPLCGTVTDGIGDGAINLAGRMTFDVWAAVLEQCRVVVANDSGGMHLASALQTPVVALYGITDPGKTGPLGPARILQHSPDRTRDVPRDSSEARFWLASIQPEEVYEAVQGLLDEGRPGPRHD